jgi:hypothetical protein
MMPDLSSGSQWPPGLTGAAVDHIVPGGRRSESARRHASQGDSLTQDTIPDPELQASRRSHLSKDTKHVLNAKGEPSHVHIAVPSVHIDKQIEVAVRSCFPTRH